MELVGRRATGKADMGILEELGNNCFLSDDKTVALLVGRNNCWKPYLHRLYIPGYLNRPDTWNMMSRESAFFIKTKGKKPFAVWAKMVSAKGHVCQDAPDPSKELQSLGAIQADDLFSWRILHRRCKNGSSEMHHCLNKDTSIYLLSKSFHYGFVQQESERSPWVTL